MEKKTKAATESAVLILVIAGILVALNALSALGGYKRIDVTKQEKYKLSRGSGNLLRSMKQNMTAEVYVTRGLPKLDTFVRDLRDLLIEYKASSEGKFDFTITDFAEEKDDNKEERKKKLKEEGLKETPFGELSDTEEKAAVMQGFMGIIFRYGEHKDVIPYLQPERSEGLEFWITNKIREVRDVGDGIKHTIGVITGHDEIKLSESNLVPRSNGSFSIQQIVTQNFKFYAFQDVDLKGGETEIDEKLDGLIITQPGKDFTEKELRRIDQFLLKGKSLAVIASAVNVKASDATMNAQLKTYGLEKLLDGYGIELRKDVVLDFGNAFHVSLMTSGGPARAWFPHFIQVVDDSRFSGDEQLLDTSCPAFFRIPEITMPLASSLVLHPEKQPDAKMKIVARTTPKAIRKTEDTVDLRPFQRWLPKGEWSQFGIAASVEFEPEGNKKFKSAFLTGEKQGVDSPADTGKSARILVIASSQYLANPLARAGNGPDMGNNPMMQQMNMGGGDEQLQQLAVPYAQKAMTPTILSFKNMLDWLSGDNDLLAVSAKILTDPSLNYGDVTKPSFDANESEEQLKKRDEEMKRARKDTQFKVTAILIPLVPLLFILLGIARWRWRIAARQNVSLS